MRSRVDGDPRVRESLHHVGARLKAVNAFAEMTSFPRAGHLSAEWGVHHDPDCPIMDAPIDVFD